MANPYTPGSREWADRAERLSDIHNFCRRLEEAWSNQPVTRFGAILANVRIMRNESFVRMEDKNLIATIEKLCGTSHDA